MDTDGNRLVDKQEFYWGLRNLGVEVTKREATILLEYLDTDKNGFVDYKEFLVGLRGMPNEDRMKMIDAAFNKFDTYGQDVIPAIELENGFDCPSHPKVATGEMTVNDAFVQFLSCFGDNENTGMITRAEWHDYYAAVSAQVQSDEQFSRLMCETWKM